MALKLLESVVLLGVPAVRGVVAGVERVDSGKGQTMNTAGQSHPQHRDQGNPDIDYPTPRPCTRARFTSQAHAARTGRSGCLTGGLAGRGPRTGAIALPMRWRRTAMSVQAPSASWLKRSKRRQAFPALQAQGRPATLRISTPGRSR